MSATRSRCAVAVVSACLAFGAVGVGAPAASADGVAGWVAGKLVSGAGGAATSYALGNLMSRAGLDPTTNALREISDQLNRLSTQISTLQETSNTTLREVLRGSFDTRYDQLDISTITKFEHDVACYVDAAKSDREREDCRARFKSQALGAQLWRIADKFNDLLTNPRSTIVQAYAKMLVGVRRFYTLGEQEKVYDLFVYLDDLQVAATMASVEAENLDAAGKGPEAIDQAEATARAEARTLEERRTLQLKRNPTAPNAGVLDLGMKLWLATGTRGIGTYWEAKGTGRWRLPTLGEVLNLVKDRGNKTVKKYLVEEAGMGTALEKVDEFGPQGEFWTSTVAYSCGLDYLYHCYNTVSTNNAYVRAYGASPGAGTPKFFSFLVSGMRDEERARYEFLWK